MDMSAAALPPIHEPISDADRAHPRFGEYQNYRAAMSRQLVSCCSFDSWLRQRIETEGGRAGTFQPNEKCDQDVYVPGKFYFNVTLPERLGGKWSSRGPFNTHDEAKTALDAHLAKLGLTGMPIAHCEPR